MIKNKLSLALAWCGLLLGSVSVNAAELDVPEPFRGFDNTSTYKISYDDLTAVLKAVVVDVGRSTREVAGQAEVKTGTRARAKVKRLTANEGNKFYYETFKDNEASRQYLQKIQAELEALPTEAPLKYFSRDEQLAYWLNLYNVTLLNQIIAEYPKRDLKKLFRAKDSILDRKLLTVAGIPLSLNDIQFTILKENYDSNPLILYGLYQGYVGGPDIRKTAYTSADVYYALENNARDFINSNRGTFSRDARTFRVSSFYDRNRAFFPNFETDLTAHLMHYLEGSERGELQAASSLKPDIHDWTVTDMGGTHRDTGGSLADSRAALLGSMQSTTPDPNNPGQLLGATVGSGSSYAAAKGQKLTRYDPELLIKLQTINENRMNENQRNANVTIEELEDDAEASDSAPAPESDDNN